MAGSTSNLDLISSSQASKEVTANALFNSASPAMLYSYRKASALTWYYYGGMVDIAGTITAIPEGTISLTASSTNYIVASRATGAVSVSTATTNWNDTTGYIKLYSVVAGASTITSFDEYRSGAQTQTVGLHIADPTDAHAASAITNTPAGTIAATTVQAAINELDTEKAALAGATFTGAIISPAGTAATPSLQIGGSADGFYATNGGVGLSINGLMHSYVGSSGQINYPSTNVWDLGTVTAFESHGQSATNTVAAGTFTYGTVLNYVSAPANLVGGFATLLTQSTFNGPTGTIATITGEKSSVILGASNLSTITTAINYDTSIIVTAGTIATGIGFRAGSTIGTTSTTSYGFQGQLASGAGKWNLYMSGTAANYLSGNLLIGSATDDGVNKLQVTGDIKTTQALIVASPVTVTAATHTVAATTTYLIGNYAGTITLTLPTASSNTGRSIRVKTITANTVISASSNVVPLVSATAGTAILAATAGKWAHLISDGTNWIIMEAN